MASTNEEVMLVQSIIESPIFTTVVGFILGVVGTQISSFIKWSKSKKEFKLFNEMIQKEYVAPIRSALEKFYNDSDMYLTNEIENALGDNVKRLNYLKNEEINYLNSSNQFKMIRLIEFTSSYFCQIKGALQLIGFQQPYAPKQDYLNYKNGNKKTIDQLSNSYDNNKEDYLRMVIDHLPTEEK